MKKILVSCDSARYPIVTGRHVLPRIGQVLSRNRHSAYNYLPASVGEFAQGESLAAQMRAAGLARVEYHRLTFGIATLYVGSK